MNLADPFAKEGLTFDDVLLIPQESHVLPADVDLKAHLAADIYLGIPILSAAMDTVTESRMAVAIAREGGIGIIHRNMTMEQQVEEVDRVKRSESGMMENPITLPPDALLSQAEELMQRFHISGVPITQHGKLVGILTNRDIRFVTDFNQPVSKCMTSESLVTAPLGTTFEEAKDILQKHRIEKLPLVDDAFNLRGLITVKDIQKKRDYPNAAKDRQGRLLVGAAVGVGSDLSERMAALLDKGLDLVTIDTSHGHTSAVLKAIKYLKGHYPQIPLIAGNVVTAEGTLALIDAGVDAVKVGIGAGSICTTRVIAGVGMPQVTAIMDCVRVARPRGIPVIADGGIKFSGDIVKALAAGADTVMLGNLLAGLEESPGELVLLEGKTFKEYRGMGSVAAMAGPGRDRYASSQEGGLAKLVPEGIEGRVAFKGPLRQYMYQLLGGLRSGMGYVGASNLRDLQEKARFVRITQAGLIESHPHDVVLAREAPNYRSMG